MCFTIDQFEQACGFLLLGEFNTFIYCCKKCQCEFESGPNLEVHILSEHEDDRRHIESVFVNDVVFVDDTGEEKLKGFVTKEEVLIEHVDVKTEAEIPDKKTLVKEVSIESKQYVDFLLDDNFRYDSSGRESITDTVPSVTVRLKKPRKAKNLDQQSKSPEKNSKNDGKTSKRNKLTSRNKKNGSNEKTIETPEAQSTSSQNFQIKKAKKSTSKAKNKKKQKVKKKEKIDKEKRRWKPNLLAVFECEMCPGVIYNHKGNLRQHMNHHINALQQKMCEICNIKPRNYDKHMKVNHIEARPYKCDWCVATFKHNLQRVIHMRSHTGERPYLCGTCGKSFRCQSSRYKHEMQTHQKKRDHSCQECDRSFYSPHQLKEHIDSVHLKLRNFHCDICDKYFGTRKYLNVHKRTHKEARLPCRYCEKMFKLCENRLKHERGVHGAM